MRSTEIKYNNHRANFSQTQKVVYFQLLKQVKLKIRQLATSHSHVASYGCDVASLR